VLLDHAGNGIEIFAALIAGQRAPALEGGAGGRHGGIYVARSAVGDVGELFAIGRIGGGEGLAGSGPGAVDEMAEGAVAAIEPGNGLIWRFRRRAVVEAVEDLRDLVHALEGSSVLLRSPRHHCPAWPGNPPCGRRGYGL